MLQEWRIKKDQLVCITTDNAANMQKAFEVLWPQFKPGYHKGPEEQTCRGRSPSLPLPCPGVLKELEEEEGLERQASSSGAPTEVMDP